MDGIFVWQDDPNVKYVQLPIYVNTTKKMC